MWQVALNHRHRGGQGADDGGSAAWPARAAGTQFTCFTGAKLQRVTEMLQVADGDCLNPTLVPGLEGIVMVSAAAGERQHT